MNPSTLLGMFVGFALVFGAVALTAEDAAVFLNTPGLVIVIGGTLAATLLSYPLGEVLRVFKVFLIILRNEKLYEQEDQKELVKVAKLWFRGELGSIENEMEQVRNPFLRTGVQMLIDNTPEEEIAELLEWRIARLKAREAAEAQIYRSMAAYAPAFGMLGTLIGLINMLHGMEGNDVERIGVNMGIALITTLYGVAIANLIFKPIAIKFERRTEHRVMFMSMIMEGVIQMSRGRSPSFIREYLRTFLVHYEDELHDAAKAASADDIGKKSKAK